MILVVSKWPLIVAIECGVYFLRDLVVRPGNGGRYPLEIALSSVETVGEKSDAWANLTWSSGVAL